MVFNILIKSLILLLAIIIIKSQSYIKDEKKYLNFSEQDQASTAMLAALWGYILELRCSELNAINNESCTQPQYVQTVSEFSKAGIKKLGKSVNTLANSLSA